MFRVTVENEREFVSQWQSQVVRPIRDATRLAVNRAAREGAQEAIERHTFQNRTGELESKIGSITDAGSAKDDFGAEIVSLAKHSSFVENGTGPHVIEARNAAVLRFVNQAGAVIYRVRVNHPGSKPHPFMSFAYFKAERVLQREVELAVAKVQERIGR